MRSGVDGLTSSAVAGVASVVEGSITIDVLTGAPEALAALLVAVPVVEDEVGVMLEPQPQPLTSRAVAIVDAMRRTGSPWCRSESC